MHSGLVRVQNLFGFATTVAFWVSILIAGTMFLHPQSPTASLQLKNVQVYSMPISNSIFQLADFLPRAKGRPYYHSLKREEYANIRFDLNADLSSLFGWNTKQVFLYLVASWPDQKNSSAPPTEAVIWDAILPSPGAPWHQNQWIHPSPKPVEKTKSGKVKKSTKDEGPYYRGSKQPGIVKLSNQKPKYQITDPTGKIANVEGARLDLRWNTQPWVGPLVWTNWNDHFKWKGLKGGKTEEFAFPEIKGSESQKPDTGTVKGGEANRGKPA